MARTFSGPSSHESISIRKIDNGFIVTHSKDSQTGYTSREVFTPTRPKIVETKLPAKKGKSR